MEKAAQTVPFGIHVMFEGYNCNSQVLDDANRLYKLLDDLPIILGMRKMIKPYIVSTEGNNKRDPGGWSGFVLIEESHISFHTFVKRRFVTADIYSCKHFDANLAIDYLKKFFKTNDIECLIEERGKRYPDKNID